MILLQGKLTSASTVIHWPALPSSSFTHVPNTFPCSRSLACLCLPYLTCALFILACTFILFSNHLSPIIVETIHILSSPSFASGLRPLHDKLFSLHDAKVFTANHLSYSNSTCYINCHMLLSYLGLVLSIEDSFFLSQQTKLNCYCDIIP